MESPAVPSALAYGTAGVAEPLWPQTARFSRLP